MAIVRTTTKDTGTTTSVTPDKTKPVAGRAAPVLPNRTLAPRPNNAGSFIAETRAELLKVKWPTREEVRSGTIVTIGLLVFFALFIFGADTIVKWLFDVLGLYVSPSSPPR
jgi:preprotein translocase subunit SecE